MTALTHLDPALFELLLTTGLSLGLIASAALTIAALPWSDDEIEQVDSHARRLAARPLAAVVALSRQAIARS
ncbi:MAG: hypothetical protein H6742_14570 [Alphaproteobacteria bacterium]|nr:hypothetical protein [Alphaproteobacteria bacterium]